jgi:hypothetical protein
MLIGRKIDLPELHGVSGDGQQIEANAPSAQTSYTYSSTTLEAEQTDFYAQGTVKTADGREISFDLSLSMSREYMEQNGIRMLSGQNVADPLVLNFNGNAADLEDARFTFDLNADGVADERINQLAAGSGFLVFDRNLDGKANNGAELFGPASGDGFSELAALDEDGNGWIDENDSVWSQLFVWQPGTDGSQPLQSLKDAGVGALAVAHVKTEFSIKDFHNALQGQIRASGVFLNEDGSVGTLQRVDLTI